MATGLKQIRSRIQTEIDLIIEVRDARIPFSSSNCDLILGELTRKGDGESENKSENKNKSGKNKSENNKSESNKSENDKSENNKSENNKNENNKSENINQSNNQNNNDDYIHKCIKTVKQNINEKKIVVFTKTDLAEEEGNKRIKTIFKEGMLFCKDDRKDLKKLLELTKSHFKDNSKPFLKNRVMVVGIPNVGKSTIINGLRSSGLGIGGKAVKVGNLAGVTRSLSELVCISRHPSLIYLIDTPGILSPRISNVEEGLKIALCGGLYDKTVGFTLLADYLLYHLNVKGNKQFKEFYRISSDKDSNDLKTFLPIAAKRIGALVPGGEYDLERTAAHFVRQFRLGKFGRLTLDEI